MGNVETQEKVKICVEDVENEIPMIVNWKALVLD